MRTSALSSTTSTRPVATPASGAGAAATGAGGGGGAPASAETSVAAGPGLVKTAAAPARGRLALELGVDVAGDDENADARVVGTDPLEGFHAAEPRHHEIEHNRVGPLPLDVQERLEPVRRREHVEARQPEGLDEDLA